MDLLGSRSDQQRPRRHRAAPISQNGLCLICSFCLQKIQRGRNMTQFGRGMFWALPIDCRHCSKSTAANKTRSAYGSLDVKALLSDVVLVVNCVVYLFCSRWSMICACAVIAAKYPVDRSISPITNISAPLATNLFIYSSCQHWMPYPKGWPKSLIIVRRQGVSCYAQMAQLPSKKEEGHSHR